VCCVYDTSGYKVNYKAREAAFVDVVNAYVRVDVVMQGDVCGVYLKLQRR
jgi:hypothetical protein